MRSVLVQRYDNEADLLDIEKRGYSDVFTRSKNEDFELLLVVPTIGARTSITVVAVPTSSQYVPDIGKDWPGRPDDYRIRIDVGNVRYTTVERVKEAFKRADLNWGGAWTVRVVELDEEIFLEPQDFADAEREEEEKSGGASKSGTLYEGDVTRIPVNRYERNPKARRECIEHYGAACTICGFDFTRAYGVPVKGYILVHHLKPLSEIKGRKKVDPIADLRPVCANCHAVLHLHNPPYAIEEMQQALKYKPDYY